jgi:hypothetical protein
MDKFWVAVGSMIALGLAVATLYAFLRYFRDNMRRK